MLTAQINIVTVCAAGAGVKATAGYTKIYNRGANPVLVYPISSAQFEDYGTNNPVSIPGGGQAEIWMSSATQGYVG